MHTNTTHKKNKKDDMNAIQLRNVHIKLGSTNIIRGVDMTVEKGKIYALLGPSGCGYVCLSFVQVLDRVANIHTLMKPNDLTFPILFPP